MPLQVYEKMGIIKNARILIVDSPTSAIKAIDLPSTPSDHQSSGESYEHVILFVKSQQNLDTKFPQYKLLLRSDGKLWIAWPKGGQLGTNLNIKEVIRIGYSHGLVESTNLRIDETWTALKFTHPKPGKVYNNSYGTLRN